MECDLCKIRSSVGYCAECHILLCEECTIRCDGCGKTVCPEHVSRTSTLRSLCAACTAEREAALQLQARSTRRRRAEAEAAGSASADQTPNTKEPMPPPFARPRPWQVSLFYTGLGAVFTEMLFFFPGLQRFPLPGGGFLRTPFVVMCVPLLGIAWALAGIARRKRDANQLWCFLSLGVAVVCMALAFLALRFPR
ncbi:MAG: hypothetical protein HY706_06610 [Candidatus Hydrogenedentes bacterium]|nr:hypothetical protein [Candidatus Hydrogenedentota bacterium]